MLLVRPIEPPRGAIYLVFSGALVVAEKLKSKIDSVVHLISVRMPSDLLPRSVKTCRSSRSARSG
jgi:hypothetical protein